MSWFCETDEAKEQMKICKENNCPDCEKCIWIQESATAMGRYGREVPRPETEHVESERQVRARTIMQEYEEKGVNSYDDMVDYAKKLFTNE